MAPRFQDSLEKEKASERLQRGSKGELFLLETEFN